MVSESNINAQQNLTAQAGQPESIESLKNSRNLLEAVFNTSTLGLHVLESIRDENGCVVDFFVSLTNGTSEKIAGRKVCGMRMLEGWPHTKEIGLFDKFVRTVETGDSVDYIQHYEGDGVSAWFRWLASKFNDGLYVSIEDVSYWKKDQEALNQSANKLRSTLDGVPAIIALLEVKYDMDGQPADFLISAANESLAIFSNSSVEELLGKSILELYPEALSTGLKEKYVNVIVTGKPLNLEFFYPGIDRWFSVLVTKQVDQKGLVVAAIDISEKKKGEEEQRKMEVLRSMDKLKTEFFSNISHELRTPLTLILGPIEELMKSKALAKNQMQKLEMVRRNTLRLLRNVNSLLDFSRIEAGRFETIYQPTDLAEYTTLLAANFRSAIEKTGLKFIVKTESTEPIYVNRNMWEKIVFNLLSNALKFTFKGEIEVRIKSLKNHVQLHVCDTGIGIASENLDRVFDRFFRIENVKARTFEGSGIGLALVKELVALHGGTIKVKSKLGNGTEFIVSIQKGKKHLPSKMIYSFNDNNYATGLTETFTNEVSAWATSKVSSAQDYLGKQSQPVILLVDDNGDIREYIKSILYFDFAIIDAGNGLKAKLLLDNGLKPDLIITDVMMPEMNGYELLNAVKSDKGLRGIPVILLSAKASEEDKITGIKSGATDYLVKPFSSSELLAVVDARIKSSRNSSLNEA